MDLKRFKQVLRGEKTCILVLNQSGTCMWDYYFNNVGGSGSFNSIIDLLPFLGVKFLKNKY